MNEKITGTINLYTRLESLAHDLYRAWWSRGYSRGQMRDAKAVCPDWKPLTSAQKRDIKAFWGLKHTISSDFITHEIMMNVKGEFDVRYCPERVFRFYLDPALSDRRLLRAWDDKNYFDRHQPEIPFPHTYVRNVNGCFLDHDYKLISREEARKIILGHLPLIAKPSFYSGEGRSIRLIANEEEAKEVFTDYDKDYLLQSLVVPCEMLKQLSPKSVASMRVITAMVNGEPKLLRHQLLCNTTDSIAVNSNTGPGVGVVIMPIDEEGKLMETAYYENAQKLKTLPNGFAFGGLQIPSFKEAVNLAIEAHKSMPMLGVIGWDITIDENLKPVFFEWNLRGIEIYHSQLSQGPLFGPYSDYFAQKVREIIIQRKTNVGYQF